MTTWSERELAARRMGPPGLDTDSASSRSEATPSRSEATGWVGWLLFAGIMLVMLGAFQAILGVVALFDDGFFVAHRNGQVVVTDYRTWGLVHVALAAIALGTGVGLLLGLKVARVIAVILCVLNVVVSFAFLGAYPWWAGMLIAFSVITAYAAVVHGGEIEQALAEA
jgi:hypothetical protein